MPSEGILVILSFGPHMIESIPERGLHVHRYANCNSPNMRLSFPHEKLSVPLEHLFTYLIHNLQFKNIEVTINRR